MPNARAPSSASIRRPLLNAVHATLKRWGLVSWVVALARRARQPWSQRVRRAAGPFRPVGRDLDDRRGGPPRGGERSVRPGPAWWSVLVQAAAVLSPQRAEEPPPLTLAQQRERWEQLRDSEWLNPLTPRMEALLERGAQILTAEELCAVNDELEAELELNRFITLAW